MDVLIAHGGEASRRSLAKVLLPLGLRLMEATDGAAALDVLLAEEAPSIALIDWDLPRRFMELPWGHAAGPDRVVAGPPPVLEAVPARE
jgi:CheY-like chemotaxis protein